MFEKRKIMFLVAETPIHAGSGSSVDVIDLPIQRERPTEFPKIESSGLKGAIRQTFEELKVSKEDIDEIFGPDQSGDFAGAIAITDARILLFPVKSLQGVFAWITCPMVIERFKRDIQILDEESLSTISSVLKLNILPNTVGQESEVTIQLQGEESVVLEEFSFKVSRSKETSELSKWIGDYIFRDLDYWKKKAGVSLVVLSDDDFSHFVRSSTEVATRIKIDDAKGTVAKGALWTEEYLPQDTIMYSLVLFSDARNSRNTSATNLYNKFSNSLPRIISVGGNQTIGKGFVRVLLY